MTLISDVKKMEDALGFKQATARQSSKLLHPRLEALQGMLKRSAEAEREVSKKSRLLLLYRQKLQESDLDELWKRYGGEDQKELLRISNTTCQAVRTQAFATRKELVAQQLRLKDAERDRDDIPEESEECWDVRRHVVERIEFALSFIEGVVDAANLRKNLNDATWELCKPGYGDSDVAEFERTNQVVKMSDQPPMMFEKARHPAANTTDGMTALVNAQLQFVQDQRAGKAKLYDEEAPGVIGYVRKCFHSCGTLQDMANMQKELVSTLQMFEAARKIETLDWENFPVL